MKVKATYRIPDIFREKLAKARESMMGIQIVSVQLKDGRRFDNIWLDGLTIRRIYDFPDLPFDPNDVVDIEVTHGTPIKDHDPSKWTDFA